MNFYFSNLQKVVGGVPGACSLGAWAIVEEEKGAGARVADGVICPL
jgi:hypothetical protein